MEENTSRPLIIAAGIILAMLIIGLAFTIYTVSKDVADEGVNQIANLATTLNESEFTQWEGDTITGSQVVSIIKQFSNEVCCISVNNGSGVTEYIYKSDLSAPASNVTVATDKTAPATYITPSAQFYCTVIRDANTDAIIGLSFVKQ